MANILDLVEDAALMRCPLDVNRLHLPPVCIRGLGFVKCLRHSQFDRSRHDAGHLLEMTTHVSGRGVLSAPFEDLR